MPEISKIKLPSGNEYNIKDATARSAIASINNWSYVVCSTAADTPKDVVWDKSGTTITGTLVAASTTMYKIYLVPSTNGTNDTYDEYITVNPSGTTYKWEMFGNTDVHLDDLGAFAYADTGTVTVKPKGTNAASSVTFGTHTTDKVLGEATTFTGADSAVTFGTPTTDTFAKTVEVTTQPSIALNVASSTSTGAAQYVQKIANSGTNAVTFATEDHTADAITGLGTASTDTFVKSYPGATSKLATTTVTGVSGSVTASKATAGTAVSVAKTGTAVTCATGSLGTETSTRGANTPMWGASVTDEVLSFTFKPISTTSVTPAASNGTITPYTFADVTVPKAATSATTVATGSLSATGGGGTVMTGLGTATTGAAVTEYASPTTATVLKSDVTATVPKVAATTRYLTATASGTAVGVATSGSAITELPTATAAGQTVTAGTNDKVTAITALGAATAAAQKFTGTSESHTVSPVNS